MQITFLLRIPVSCDSQCYGIHSEAQVCDGAQKVQDPMAYLGGRGILWLPGVRHVMTSFGECGSDGES